MTRGQKRIILTQLHTTTSLTRAQVSLNLDFSELTDKTTDISGTTEFIIQDGSIESRKAASEIKLSNFNNDSGWTSNTGDITEVTAGSGLTGGGTSGAVTVSVGVDNSTTEIASDQVRVKDLGITTAKLAADAVNGTKIADDSINSEHYVDGSIDTAHIADDQITHAKLEARYTQTAASVTTSGATTINWSAAGTFPVTMGGGHTLNFSNYKTGQVIDLIITGNYAVTFGTTSGTPTFNKVGTTDYDGTATNIIQVMCTDEDSTPTFFYAIGTYTSDPTP